MAFFKTPGQIRPEDEKTVHAEFEESMRDARRHSGFLRGLFDDARTLYAMLRDPEFRLDWGTKAKILFALIYFISPIDFIPDFIPGIGYLDDAVVLMLVIRSLGEAVKRYRQLRSTSAKPLVSSGTPKPGATGS